MSGEHLTAYRKLALPTRIAEPSVEARKKIPFKYSQAMRQTGGAPDSGCDIPSNGTKESIKARGDAGSRKPRCYTLQN
jgi:hypothetical protein